MFSWALAWMLSSLLYSSCGESAQGGEGPERRITVSIQQQVVLFQEGDREANLALVSTGKSWGYATPRGEFRVLYRLRNPMSSTYNVRMPYWLCIVPCGAIGFHQVLGSGEARLGEPLSHGCVRLGRHTARWAYAWVPTGAPVFIH